MKFCFLFCGAALFAEPLIAQSLPTPLSNYGQTLITSAGTSDQAWNALNSLQAKRLDKQVLTPGVDSSTLFSQSDQFLQLSLAAKTFYTTYPQDNRAAAARKAEALFALQAVQAGASTFQTTANQLATAFVADSTNAVGDRFDIQNVLETTAVAPALDGKPLSQDGASYRKVADDLYAKFGPIPQVLGVYVSLMRTADSASGAQAASFLNGVLLAPAWVKTEAQNELKRCALLGKPLAQKLATTDGQTIDLGKSVNQPTVILFWNGQGDGIDLARLSTLVPQLATGVRWIYVGLGRTSAPTPDEIGMAPVAGQHCVEAAQFGGPITSAMAVEQTPFAYVLNSAGNVSGFGTPAALPSLLTAATK